MRRLLVATVLLAAYAPALVEHIATHTAMTAPSPVPSGSYGTDLATVNHVGFTVADLDRSIAFYTALTGREPAFVNEMHGEGLAAGAEVPGARLRFAIIDLDNVRLELIEYLAPEGRTDAPTAAHNDVGSFHIAYTTDDIVAAYDRLREAGVHFNAPPHTFTEADGAPAVVGATFAYLRDPDGLLVELNQPDGSLA